MWADIPPFSSFVALRGEFSLEAPPAESRRGGMYFDPGRPLPPGHAPGGLVCIFTGDGVPRQRLKTDACEAEIAVLSVDPALASLTITSPRLL